MKMKPTTLFICDQCDQEAHEDLNYSGDTAKNWWVVKTPSALDSAVHLCNTCGPLLAAIAKTKGRVKEMGVNPEKV